jgi:hypothetical protein
VFIVVVASITTLVEGSYMNDLAKLNRLRVNAGKPELQAFKGGQVKLDAAIKTLEDAGHTDVLPGANADAAPVTDDPEVQAVLPTEEPEVPEKKEPTKTNGKPSLARGLDTDSYAKHSRTAVRDHREREKREAAQLSPEDKAQIKAEAKARQAKGEVDPKKDPSKAARQKQHIADKQAKRKLPARQPRRGRRTLTRLPSPTLLANSIWIRRSLVRSFGVTRTRSASCTPRGRIAGRFRNRLGRLSPTSSSKWSQNIVALAS